MTINARVPTPFAGEALACLQTVHVGGFEECHFQKISRSGNGVVHELARVAVESLKNIDLENRLSRKALLALKEEERNLAMPGKEERPERHG
ncbi:hypothetical protein Goari_000486 [Gossypium aridum]|uniref:Uncharacterized protein n=1 Tax=Gossypium aridum TaxID=34290 RepID=A0A7J8YGU2_GOSAI|nr:hypothetical protein [Gossypium aridum]